MHKPFLLNLLAFYMGGCFVGALRKKYTYIYKGEIKWSYEGKREHSNNMFNFFNLGTIKSKMGMCLEFPHI